MSKDRCKRQERMRAGFESLGSLKNMGREFGGRGGTGGMSKREEKFSRFPLQHK